MLERTKKYCDSFLELGLPGFDLAVFKGGECILRHINGYRDPEENVKMNGSERFNLYSASKVITCTAALQLWEQGLFSLRDPLLAYMPEFQNMTVRTENGLKKAKKPILIRHLFEMTAGFSYDTASPGLKKCRKETDGRCPTRQAVKYLAADPLLFEPGERWEYSLCHDVLAALVEVISGEKFEDYVKRHIFDALGMIHSTFMLPESEIETIAPQYRFEDGKAVRISNEIATYKIGREYASGGAGGIATVDDYITFLEALRTNKLLNPKTLKLMATDRLTEKQKQNYWVKTHGYGLGVRCPKGDNRYVDFGWGGAAGAFLAIDTNNEITLFFGAHTLSSPVQGLRTMLYRLVRAELMDTSDLDEIQKELIQLHRYHLTY